MITNTDDNSSPTPPGKGFTMFEALPGFFLIVDETFKYPVSKLSKLTIPALLDWEFVESVMIPIERGFGVKPDSDVAKYTECDILEEMDE